MKGIWLSVLVLSLGVAGGAVFGGQDVFAQEQFFTQSGGRGLQNAKTNARLTKTETDVGVIQEDLKTIQPHARAQLGSCANTGEKLKYDGRNWICEKETDPTVKGFAKKDLPSCTGSSILGVSGGDLSCVDSGFVSNETDPTVQAYAKTPLPNCGLDQVLSVTNGVLACQSDQKGLTLETDPKVHNFARKDVVTALPNCGSNELLTMTGGMLSCKVDSVGITVERDPLVQNFARNDLGQPDLAACAAGEVLNATTVDGKVLLSCTSAVGAVAGLMALNDLSDVNSAGAVSGTVLTYSAGEWKALPGLGTSGNPLLLSQLGDVQVSSPVTDQLLRFDGTRWANSTDKVATVTDTNWCHVSGGRIVCDRPMPLTCGATEALNWSVSSSTWVCSDLGTAVAQSIGLNNLNDVTITTPSVGNALVYDGAGWVNTTLNRILAGDSQVVVTDSGSDGLISFATEGQTHMAITNQGRIGVGIMPSAPYMVDISGATRVAGDLTVTGNLNISGSQSIDGVIFANGGIEMPGTLTSGQISATNLSATLADIVTLRAGAISTTGNISANQFIGDGSLLTNLPAPSALSWYAITNIPAQVQAVSESGAIVMAGISSTNASVTTDLSVGGTLTAGSASFGPAAMTGLTVTGNSVLAAISATNISATGTISANAFIGDGSGLTNVTANPTDRISSTNNQAMVVARPEGTVSFTLGGTAGAAYLHPTLGLVASGVSTTGGISGTTGYFSRMGLGGYNPNSSYALDVGGDVRIGSNLHVTGLVRAYGGALTLRSAASNVIIQPSTTEIARFTLVGLGIATANPSTTLHVSGTLRLADGGEACDSNRTGAIKYASGTFYFCSGSAWQSLGDIAAASSDRITSGTTNVYARNDGSISFTTAGVTTGYFYNGQLVAGGISTTGAISVTSAYFAGNVGVATLSPSKTLHVQGDALIGNTTSSANGGNILTLYTGNTINARSGLAVTRGPASSGNSLFGFQLMSDAGGTYRGAIGYNAAFGSAATFSEKLTFTANNVGIDVVYPSATLHVSGTLRLANGSEACDSNRTGAIRYTGGEFSFCRNGTSWETMGDIASSSADRITSGTTNVYARNDGSISFTTAGVTTGYFYNGQLVAGGVSATGTISGTTGYFSERFAIGTPLDSSRALSVQGSARFFSGGAGDFVIGHQRYYGTYSSRFNTNGSNFVFSVDNNNLLWLNISQRVGILRPTPTTALDISGTLRIANGSETCDSSIVGAIRYTGGEFSFCRNGSSWETMGDIASSSADRITSGTTNVYARNDGSISFTTAGVTTGYFYNGQLVAGGVSSTGAISGTTGYFAGNVGIASLPSTTATLAIGTVSDGVTSRSILLQTTGGSIYNTRIYSQHQANDSFGIQLGGANLISSTAQAYDQIQYGNQSTRRHWYPSGRVVIGGSNQIGVIPSTTLTVNGTIRIANGAEACDSNRTGAIRYTGGEFSFCRNGTSWETMGDIASSSADRITSGTTNVYARSDGSISFTTAGTTTGYFYNGQLVANAVSTTGAISATGSGYFGGNVAIGTINTVTDTRLVIESIGASSGQLRLTRSSNAHAAGITFRPAGALTSFNPYWRFGLNDNSPGITLVKFDGTTSYPMYVASTGYVGLSTIVPSTTLDVSGTLRIANGGEACDAMRTGGIRYNSGVFEFCAGSSWQSLAAMASASATAAGVTGSIQFKGASNEISGTNTLTVTSAANRADVAVSGTVKISGDSTEACSAASDYGQMRFVNVGGVMQMQICRP